jgi:predicted alpha/beta hydrolase family esterase
MKKKALILEAWYNKPDDNWYPWLKKELEKKGYEVLLPDLPDQRTDHPSLAKQIKFIDGLHFLDKDTVVIGHSLGAVLGMRLGEVYKFKKLITVAGWDYNDLCEGHKLFWKTTMQHKKIKKNVREIYCIGSDNDPYYTKIAFEDTANRLGGKFVFIKGKSHFSQKSGGVTQIPQLLK